MIRNCLLKIAHVLPCNTQISKGTTFTKSVTHLTRKGKLLFMEADCFPRPSESDESRAYISERVPLAATIIDLTRNGKLLLITRERPANVAKIGRSAT
jgi:hypothetical protein